MAAPERLRRRLLSGLALACIALQFGGSLAYSGLALSLWLLAMARSRPEVLRRLWMPRFWSLTALFALGSGFLLGPRDLELGWLRLSSQGLASGALMMVRGAFIFALATWASRSLSGSGLRRVARRLGLGSLADAVGVALKLLPELSQRLAVARAGAPAAGRLRFVYGTAVDLIAETARLAAEMGEGTADSGRIRLPVVAVLGEPDSGKTQTLGTLIRLLREQGLRAGGIQQPKLMEGGKVVGYDLRDVSDGKVQTFARRSADSGDPRVGFTFEQAGWAWAAERLGRAAAEADFVVVDELGWLEADGDGHAAALGAVTPGRARFVLAAVRSVCAEALQRRLGPFAHEVDSTAEDEELELLVETLVRLYGKGKA